MKNKKKHKTFLFIYKIYSIKYYPASFTNVSQSLGNLSNEKSWLLKMKASTQFFNSASLLRKISCSLLDKEEENPRDLK